MRRIRIIHKLRTLAALLVFCSVLAGGVGLWWANRTGLPDAWRTEIEKALAAQGLHADIAGLRYSPLRGIEADEVIVYSDESRQRVIARISEVVVDVDRTKLAKGEVRVERLDLKNGSLSLPADPDDPDSKVLEIADASGRVLMPGGRRIEVRGARGYVSGIRMEFEALLLGYSQQAPDEDYDEEEALLYRRKLLTRVIGLLEPWEFDPKSPPVIRIRVEGDLDDPRTARADIRIESDRLERDGIKVSRLAVAGEIRGRLLAIESFDIEDDGGSLRGRMEYDMAGRSGHFDARSDLDLPALLRNTGAAGWLEKVTFQSRPEVTLRGSFEWPEDSKPEFRVTGHLAARELRFRGHSAPRLECDFSADGSNLFVDNLRVTRPDGTFRGRLLAQREQVRVEASTDLRVGVWRGLFESHPLGKVLADFDDRSDTQVDARIEVTLIPGDPHGWSAAGSAWATHMSYRGTPFREARVNMDLDHESLDFTAGTVEFDYTDYPLRKAHGGPLTGHATVDRVRYDRAPSTLTLEGIEGEFWPAPVLRMFLPQVADHLENYRFHKPPRLSGGGVIGLFHGGPKTDFNVTGTTPENVSYQFAGTDLELSDLRARVRVKPRTTEVRDLAFEVFSGPVRGRFDVVPDDGGQRVKGEIDWTRLSLPEMSIASGFKKQAKGYVTGRIDFDYLGKAARGLDGKGLIALEEGELFSVPIFGPLSPVLSAVLANRKAGFQQAKEAFCTFVVEDGVLSTTDFLTTTPSLVFTGDARADLNRMTLDMTLRMNARGLLGVITLPLKPFYGLFQFRGVGPLRAPQWDNVMFTSPPESEEELLLAPPKATGVAPAPGR